MGNCINHSTNHLKKFEPFFVEHDDTYARNDPWIIYQSYTGNTNRSWDLIQSDPVYLDSSWYLQSKSTIIVLFEEDAQH
jgi:hypothetical protein